ncbi:MAG: hypothetical protein PHF70_00680 [Opitutales bacterium]|nr:hypothetical protein [Opitutales bacterium]
MSIWNVKPELIDQTLFYNNCFVNANGFSSVAHFNFGLNAANPFFSETTGFPYEVPPGNLEAFINSGKQPGAPIAANALTDAGVTNHASELRKDILGYTRDALPDIGAYEWNATSTPSPASQSSGQQSDQCGTTHDHSGECRGCRFRCS